MVFPFERVKSVNISSVIVGWGRKIICDVSKPLFVCISSETLQSQRLWIAKFADKSSFFLFNFWLHFCGLLHTWWPLKTFTTSSYLAPPRSSFPPLATAADFVGFCQPFTSSSRSHLWNWLRHWVVKRSRWRSSEREWDKICRDAVTFLLLVLFADETSLPRLAAAVWRPRMIGARIILLGSFTSETKRRREILAEAVTWKWQELPQGRDRTCVWASSHF
jgi:hypothetical protein